MKSPFFMMNNDESTPLTTLFPFHSLSSQPLAHSPHLGLQATFSHQSTDSLSLVFYGRHSHQKTWKHIRDFWWKNVKDHHFLSPSVLYIFVFNMSSYLFNSLHHHFPSKSPEILRAPGQVAVQGFAGYLWGPARWRWLARREGAENDA